MRRANAKVEKSLPLPPTPATVVNPDELSALFKFDIKMMVFGSALFVFSILPATASACCIEGQRPLPLAQVFQRHHRFDLSEAKLAIRRVLL